MKILIATHNRGKLREYAALLAGLPIEWVTLDDVGVSTEVEETGSTFEQNALLKAEAYARLSGLPTLADDSGLEVDALGGAPGVQSARYAGSDASDADRYRLLLERMKNVPDAQRSARFRCVVALYIPGGEVYTAEGICEGRITHAPRGTYGFGYDPVFFVNECGVTMAELAPEIKNRISHRARAVQALRPQLAKLFMPSGEDRAERTES
jgi:XTP/dITP diphosphohydrolase